MTLLNSIALVAASALIVPILVHLRKRRKSRVVDWPAMQFLTRTMASRRRGLRLEEFLLLLLRCLIVLLFVFAMARPVIPSGQTLRWSLIAGLFAGGLITLVASLVGQMTRARRASGIVVAALLFAVAASLLRSRSLPLETWGADQDVAIVIDGSSTMMIQENSQSQFQQAIEKASALTRQLSGQSTVSIILAGPVSQTVEGSPFRNLRSAEQSLGSLKPTSGGSNLSQALDLAKAAVSKGANPRRQIVVFTDNQLHNWESVADAAIAADDAPNAAAATIPPAHQESDISQAGVSTGNDNLDPVRYAAHVAKLPVDVVNLSVDSITLKSPVPTINRPTPCDIEITNHGTKTVRDLKLTLLLNGQSTHVETVAQLESGTSRTVRFLPVFTSAGSNVLQAKIEQPETVPAELREPLLEDNRAFSVIEVISNLKILVVNGNSFANKTDQSATFAQLALDPLSLQDRRDNREPIAALPENSRAVQVQDVDVAELAAMDDTDSFHVILLCDVPRLPRAAATQLARYVSDGGRLWVIPEQSADTEFYNAWKSDEADDPMLPCQLMERLEHAANANAAADVNKAVSIASETAGTPWLKELFERGEHDLFDLTVSSCWKLAPRDRSVQYLKLTTDNPLFVDHAVGKGRVLLQSISLTQNDSNLISRVSFPVLMHLWTQSLTAGQSPEANLAPGSNLTVELSRRHGSSLNPVDDENEPAIAELTLVRPLSEFDEQLISVNVDNRDGHAFVSIANAVTPGVYELRSKNDQTILQSFTVTRDRKESDFAIASEERLTELAAKPAFQWFRNIDELTTPGITTDGGREIWKTLAFAVLWLLAAESLLIRWIRKRRWVPQVPQHSFPTEFTPVETGFFPTHIEEKVCLEVVQKAVNHRDKPGGGALSRPRTVASSLKSEGGIP
ncbi:MAG: VWA domain-containing protein [Planctomycetota bacterium]